jgi:hypothetical protein
MERDGEDEDVGGDEGDSEDESDYEGAAGASQDCQDPAIEESVGLGVDTGLEAILRIGIGVGVPGEWSGINY